MRKGATMFAEAEGIEVAAGVLLCTLSLTAHGQGD